MAMAHARVHLNRVRGKQLLGIGIPREKWLPANADDLGVRGACDLSFQLGNLATPLGEHLQLPRHGRSGH